MKYENLRPDRHDVQRLTSSDSEEVRTLARVLLDALNRLETLERK